MDNIDPVHYPDMGLVGSQGQAILQEQFGIAASEMARPFHLMAAHCKVSIDGDQWCVLYGENLQDGVAGFGDSPDLASRDFDDNWFRKLPAHKE